MLPDIRVRQRDYLLEIARDLTQELDLDKLLLRILSFSIEIVSGLSGFIALRNYAGLWHIQVTQEMPETVSHYLNEMIQRDLKSNEATGHEDLQKLNLFLNKVASYTTTRLTGVGLPLIAQNRVIGVIYIFRNAPNLFSNNDRSLLSSFADQAAIAVQNAQLYQMVNNEKQRTEAIINSVADGMLVLTPCLSIQECNPALSRMLTLNKDEILSFSHSQIIQWATPPQGITLEKAVRLGWPLTPNAQLYIEGDVIRKNEATPLPIGITYAPIISKENTLVSIVASVRDITHFRKLDEMKSTFISIVSHELKTPVALIKGYVSTLRREDVRWEQDIVQDSLQVIEEEADHLTVMIEDLLDATRLQAGKLRITRIDSQIKQLVEHAAEKLQTQTLKHTLKVEFPDSFPIIMADEKRIEQVITNLVSNSIKYAPGGDIIISGRVQPDQVIICVSDQGPGIAPQDMPHIFDRFYRSPEMAKSTKGTGLGLYLSKAIIEAHGGQIWVTNENGRGAKICFSLPGNEDFRMSQ